MNKELIGKTLTGLQLYDDKIAINFLTTDGPIKASCDADCCSFTWVEHIELPALGFPAKVLSVEDLDMPDLGDMENCDVVAYYGFKVTTDKGEITIDYRNDSNGYYGGNLTWDDEEHYGGVSGQNDSTENWVDVTKDI